MIDVNCYVFVVMFVSFLESENIYKCLFQFESCLQISWISITSIFRKKQSRIFMVGNQLDDDFPKIFTMENCLEITELPSIHLPNCLAVGFQGNHTREGRDPPNLIPKVQAKDLAPIETPPFLGGGLLLSVKVSKTSPHSGPKE